VSAFVDTTTTILKAGSFWDAWRSPPDSVGESIMLLGSSVCALVRPIRYCYHDISRTAWTVLIKLARNIREPLLMSDDLVRCWVSKVKVTPGFKCVVAKVSTSTLWDQSSNYPRRLCSRRRGYCVQSRVSVCLFVRALKWKRLELSTPNFVHL